jgi:cytosine deaminase
MTTFDLIVRRGKLLNRPGYWDIAISGEEIAAIEPRIDASGATEIDAAENLVAPSYVNGHVHLDKCNLGDVMRPNLTNSFQECLEITWEHKRNYTVEDIVVRASAAIEEGILNGTTVFRVFADVDSIGGLKPIEGILA